MIIDNNEEKELIRGFFNYTSNDLTKEADNLILDYLDPYVQDGIDAITDDGYLLYLADIRQEMLDYLYSHLTREDFLKISVANTFEDDKLKKEVTQRIFEVLNDKYEGYAPIPKRPLADYIKYSDSEKTKKDFEICYHEYVKAIEELEHIALDLVEILISSRQSDNVVNKSSILNALVNQLEQLKDKESFKKLTYNSSISPSDLFYQDIFLNEDSKNMINNVKEQVLDFRLPKHTEIANYSLEEIYNAIPKDIISYDLLENDEIDPNSIDHNIAFVQNFYHLASLFVKDADKDENFEDTVYNFLINKISEFQERLYDSYYPDVDEDIDAFSYSKREYYPGKRY